MSVNETIGNAAAMREALKACMDYLWRVDHPMNDVMRGLFKTAYDKSQAALAKPPRACDLMTEEELLLVVSRSIVASVSARPELNEEWIKSLVVAAVAAAIKCAYDTELKSNKEANNDD